MTYRVKYCFVLLDVLVTLFAIVQMNEHVCEVVLKLNCLFLFEFGKFLLVNGILVVLLINDIIASLAMILIVGVHSCCGIGMGGGVLVLSCSGVGIVVVIVGGTSGSRLTVVVHIFAGVRGSCRMATLIGLLVDFL